jgi:hypothetical protein
LGVDSGRSPHYYFSMRPRTLDVDRGIDTSCRYSRDHRRENGKTMIPRNRYADQRGGFMSSLGDRALPTVSGDITAASRREAAARS